MNDPKRLMAEPHSALAHELLRAAETERVPDVLRQRMAEGFAAALGATSIGVGFGVGSSAVQSGAVGAAAGESAIGSGAAGLAAGGANVAAGGGASLAQGTAWATSAVWVKGALSVCALTGAVGLGTLVERWLEPAAVVDGGVAAPVVVQPVAPEAHGAQTAPAPVPEVSRGGEVEATKRVVSDGVIGQDRGEATGGRRVSRSSSKAPAGHEEANKQTGDLGREVRMLDAARRAIISGDIGAAREKLAQYGRAFPQGALRAEAASLAKAAADAE